MNRLLKLLKVSKSFEEFKSKAIKLSGWYLRPFVQAGIKVDAPFIQNFWTNNKGSK